MLHLPKRNQASLHLMSPAICHADRLRADAGREQEWKDPEDVPPRHAASGNSHKTLPSSNRKTALAFIGNKPCRNQQRPRAICHVAIRAVTSLEHIACLHIGRVLSIVRANVELGSAPA